MTERSVSAEFVGAMYLVGQLYRLKTFTSDQLKNIDQCLATVYSIETGRPCDNNTMTELVKSEAFQAYSKRIKQLIDQREEEGVLKKKGSK